MTSVAKLMTAIDAALVIVDSVRGSIGRLQKLRNDLWV